MRPLGWVVGGLGAVLAAALIAHAVTGEAQPSHVTAPVVRSDLTSTVIATGSLRAVVTVDVGSQLSGQVAEVLVDFNDAVERGRPLARLDTVSLEARVREAQAALESARTTAQVRQATEDKAAAALNGARAQLRVLEARQAQARASRDEARRELERKQALYDKGNISVSEVESARSAADGAEAALREAAAAITVQDAEIRQAEAALRVAGAERANADAAVAQQEALLEQAEIELRRATIRAPIDGVVIRRNVEPGQTVAASLEAPTLFTLAGDLANMTVHAKVDETDIGAITPGQRAVFTVDAYPEREFQGIVTQIRKAPDVVRNVVSYTVLVSAANPALVLLPGMTATVRIVVEEIKDALTVPNAALRFRGGGDGRQWPTDRAAFHPATVWVLDPDGAPEPVEIEIGAGNGELVQVAPGPLEEGDRVIVGTKEADAAEDPFGIRFGL